jgi:hypothetical protein
LGEKYASAHILSVENVRLAKLSGRILKVLAWKMKGSKWTGKRRIALEWG